MNVADTVNNPSASSALASASQSMLEKDDFLKLLMTELQHQDPTDPMNSDKILSQTSQLATMESAQNTQEALEKLSSSLSNNRDFSTISAIGKTADLGSGEIKLPQEGQTDFDIYFPEDIKSGQISIQDSDGNVIKTVSLQEQAGGVLNFKWDGTNNNGEQVQSGAYYANAQYLNQDGQQRQTRVGTYPISSVKFDEGKTFLRLGSDYVSLDKVKEIF